MAQLNAEGEALGERVGECAWTARVFINVKKESGSEGVRSKHE